MTYNVRFSIIKISGGLVGIRNEIFEAEDLNELKAQIEAFFEENDTKALTHIVDEIEDENGNEIEIGEEEI